MINLKGVITAIVTPFKEGKLDEKGFVQNIHTQLEAGVGGILGLGVTGECATQTQAEQNQVIKILVREAKGKVPIIIGTGTNFTAESIEKTKIAKDLGADLALIISPYFNKPTQEGIFRHFEAICGSVNLPIIVYNHPGRTSINIEISTFKRIATLKNVIAIKDDIPHISEIIHKTNLRLFSSDDNWTLAMMALGAVGVVSVLSNLVPRKVVEMVAAANKGDFIRARKIHYELLPLVNAAFIETNPCPIKQMMNFAGLPAGDLRLPLTQVSEENKKFLKQLMQGLGLYREENKSGRPWRNRNHRSNLSTKTERASLV